MGSMNSLFTDLRPFHEVHNLVVQHEHNGSTGATQDVGKRALEESLGSFVLENLLEAVFHSLVDLLTFWLGCLDLQATLHGVKRVSDDAGNADSQLRDAEL